MKKNGYTLIEMIIVFLVIGTVILLSFLYLNHSVNSQQKENIAKYNANLIFQFTKAVNSYVATAEQNGTSDTLPNINSLRSPITYQDLVQQGLLSNNFGEENFNNSVEYNTTKLGQNLVGYVNMNYGFPTSIGVFETGYSEPLNDINNLNNSIAYNSFKREVGSDLSDILTANNDLYTVGLVNNSTSSNEQSLTLLNTTSSDTSADNLYDYFNEIVPINNLNGYSSLGVFIKLQENPGYLLLLVQGYGSGQGAGNSTEGTVADWSVYNYGYSEFCPSSPSDDTTNINGVEQTNESTSIIPEVSLNSGLSTGYYNNQQVSTLNIGQDLATAFNFPNSTSANPGGDPIWAYPSAFLNTYVCLPATQSMTSGMQTPSCTKNPNNCELYTTTNGLNIINGSGNNGNWNGSLVNGGNQPAENTANAYLLLNLALGGNDYTVAGWSGAFYIYSPDLDAGYAPVWRVLTLSAYNGYLNNPVSFYIQGMPFNWNDTPNGESVYNYFLNGNEAITSPVTATNINLTSQTPVN